MSALQSRLVALLGATHVQDDRESRALSGADLFDWPGSVVPDLVIRPGSTEEAAAAMRLIAEEGRAVVPRGAGLSYTAGVVPRVPAIVMDTARLATIRVDAPNLTAVVGAGVTWQALAEALAPHGLRSAQVAPISGAVTTVGGVAAQNIPGGMEGILGVAVVLADGSVARTGALALAEAPPFWRHMGPDLTGLFLGDCGAFGIKTEIALRLAPEREAAFASFAFADGAAMMSALVAVQQHGLVARALAMDPVRGRSATQVEAGEALRTAAAVASRAGSLMQAVRDVAGLALARSADPAWTLHLTAEGVTHAAAEAGIAKARLLATQAGGQEVEPAIPRALRARPYSIRGFVGPEGERWVPVHGMLPLDAARDCLIALEAAQQELAPEFERHGISVSHIVSSLGAYVTIEPMFYWRDALDPIHLRHLSEKNRARFGGFAPNTAARDAVRTARTRLCGVLDAHGAVHAQIGRHYALATRMEPGAAALLQQVKAMLDPAGRMNPGVLGLGEDS
jgi:D-lactate dehydrogenase (cytochrome)